MNDDPKRTDVTSISPRNPEPHPRQRSSSPHFSPAHETTCVELGAPSISPSSPHPRPQHLHAPQLLRNYVALLVSPHPPPFPHGLTRAAPHSAATSLRKTGVLSAPSSIRPAATFRPSRTRRTTSRSAPPCLRNSAESRRSAMESPTRGKRHGSTPWSRTGRSCMSLSAAIPAAKLAMREIWAIGGAHTINRATLQRKILSRTTGGGRGEGSMLIAEIGPYREVSPTADGRIGCYPSYTYRVGTCGTLRSWQMKRTRKTGKRPRSWRMRRGTSTRCSRCV